MFNKIDKRYNLQNSYFRMYREYDDSVPQDPVQCLKYYQEYKEWPFKGLEDKGTIEEYYAVWCEYQKKKGVYLDQYFTPPKVAEQLARIAMPYITRQTYVMDACCGFGMLSYKIRELCKIDDVYGFDTCDFEEEYRMFNDLKNVRVYPFNFIQLSIEYAAENYSPFSLGNTLIVSNPPYTKKELVSFLKYCSQFLGEDERVIAILPKGFIDKKEKGIQTAVSSFSIEHQEDSCEEFERTKTITEIVVLKRSKDEK